MLTPREDTRSGIECLNTVTALLQRVRAAHPTSGIYEAAEMAWWWSVPRSTDSVDQLFWFDDDGLPVAAAMVTDWGNGTSAVYESTTLALIVLPDASRGWIEHVVERGLAHVTKLGIAAIELEVGRDDVLRDVLLAHGFTVKEDGLIQCWLDVKSRPPVSALSDGYRLSDRSELTDRPHHMSARRGPDFERRLHDTSLYRADLDLVVLDSDDEPAAYGIFWFDPVTSTGVVEPMRTYDAHQQRGLGRHILTTGIDRLARAGAHRISIGFEPENPASGPLYLSAGFVPHRQTDVVSR